MKIVHIITRLITGGADENTVYSCVSQAEAGHDVYLIHGKDYVQSFYDEIDSFELIKADKMVHEIAPFMDFAGYRQIKNILEDIKPDIVHTHTSKAGFLGRLAAKAAGVPIIINGVHIVPFVNVSFVKKMIYLTAEKLADRITDFHIDVSRGVKEVYIDAGLGSSENHQVIHSGFDLAKFQNAEPMHWKELEAFAHLDEKPPIILMLAALEPRKRHEALIAAFPRLIERIPNAQLIFAGKGDYEEAITNTIKKYGLEDSVHILGYRPDPERLIAMADICTMVSEREGLPRVLMQYIAAGKPCIATDLPGLDEVLHHNINGILMNGDDVEGVVEEIARVLNTPSVLKRLSEGARNTDLSSWQTEKMCDDILKVYEMLASQKL